MSTTTPWLIRLRRLIQSGGRRWGIWLLLIGLIPGFAAGADPYAYKPRGDRSEGILAQPVSGNDIVLISARAAPVGGPATPERMRLSFYLPEQEAVQVTVRELDNRNYYWMDDVRPPKPWRAGRINSFVWPTRDVLLHLYRQQDEEKRLTTADLGALVRLSNTGPPSARERVAPAILSGDGRPVTPERYLFTFKSNLPARLTCALFPSSGQNVLWSKTFKRVSAGQPFTCQVPLRRLRRGDYRLELDGYSLDTNKPVRRQVRFFHDGDLK